MLLEVGRVAKAHGLRGEVLVVLTTDRRERVAPGSVLTTAGGRRLEVVRSSPHHHRFVVAFRDVEGRDEADALHGEALYAEPLDDPGALWVHELIGAEVQDRLGRVLGRVTAVEANPASDLLVLDGGGLIPSRFVTGTGEGRVVVDIPDGLLDL